MNSKSSSSYSGRPRHLAPIISPTPTSAIHEAEIEEATTATKKMSRTSTHVNTNVYQYPESEGQSRSATVTKLNKVIKQLSRENRNLKDEITELRDTAKQIFNENRHEKYDERRINLIKFQVIQLERQISILTEALGSRSEAVLEVENSLSMIADKLRSFISADVKGQMVPIARSDLMNLVESSESSRIKLFKSMEKNTHEELGKDLLYLNPCLNNRKQEGPITLLDINLRRFDFLNLRYVAHLESKLSLLYKDLVGIHNQVESVQREKGNCRLLDGVASEGDNERLKTSLLKAGVMIKDCTDDLLALSLLCPSAPWPVLKRPVVKDIPLEKITSALPPMSQSKQEEVSHLLKACVSTMNHRVLLLQKEKSVLEEELSFHRAVYDTQMKYTNVVFDAVKEGCKEFEESARTLLCAPLKSILEAYNFLETTKSKDALREILLLLKSNESQIKSIVEMFEDPSRDNSINRSQALSSFSTEFMHHVNSLVSSCQEKRDNALHEKKEVKDRLKTLDTELRQCIGALEVKYDKQWVPKEDKFTTDSSRLPSPSHNPFDHDLLPTNCSSSKEFIHSQLFGDEDDRAHSSTSGPRNDQQDPNKCQDKRKMNDIDNLNDNMGALKLRSFLDDENDCRYSENQLHLNEKNTNHKTKWVSDFGSCDRTVSDTEHDKEMEKNQPQPSAIKKSTQAWKPEKEWVNDFNSDSNRFDFGQVQDPSLGLRSRENSHFLLDGSHSTGKTPKEKGERRDIPISKPGSKVKAGRRTYEVDLRVANHKLKLKRQGSTSDLFHSKKN